MTKTAVVWLGAMLCCLLWGSAFPFIKIGYEIFQIPGSDTAAQILFAGIRFFFAGIMTIIAGSCISKKMLYPKKSAWGKVLWLSLLQTILQYLFFYIGLAHTSGVKASIVEAVNVFVAIIVSCLLFHQEKLTVRKMIGCIVGFAGVVIVNMNGLDVHLAWNGEGFILLSTVAYAFSSVFLKMFSKEENPVMLSGYQFVIGGFIMAVAGFLVGGRITSVTPAGVGLLIYLAAVSAVAYTIWGLLLKYNPVSKVAVFGFMNPVFGVILSALLLGEGSQAAGITCIIALILVCLGIYVVNSKEKRIISDNQK